MARCTYSVDDTRFGHIRCAEEAASGRARCATHLGLAPGGLPFGEALAASTIRTLTGCLVWLPLAARSTGSMRRRAADFLAPEARRPTFWHEGLGIYVDLGEWLFLEASGRARLPGSAQRCRTVGCVEPDHCEEPTRRRGRRRPANIESELDRQFDWGAA